MMVYHWFHNFCGKWKLGDKTPQIYDVTEHLGGFYNNLILSWVIKKVSLWADCAPEVKQTSFSMVPKLLWRYYSIRTQQTTHQKRCIYNKLLKTLEPFE